MKVAKVIDKEVYSYFFFSIEINNCYEKNNFNLKESIYGHDDNRYDIKVNNNHFGNSFTYLDPRREINGTKSLKKIMIRIYSNCQARVQVQGLSQISNK